MQQPSVAAEMIQISKQQQDILEILDLTKNVKCGSKFFSGRRQNSHSRLTFIVDAAE